MPHNQPASIRRAILSVSDKRSIVELGRFLAARGVEILSTGGTAAVLRNENVPVIPISDYTGSPEMLGGRVKTLNPRIFGGILADRSSAGHRKDCEQHGVGEIDLVAVNLYPFEETVGREGVTPDEAIEQIDIGGPSMLRAAAKNHRHVLPLCDPSLYEPFMRELDSGSISEAFRRRAAVETFRRTSSYDRHIARYLAQEEESHESGRLELTLDPIQSLRYGENPQQSAAFYRVEGLPGERVPSEVLRQLHGKDLSYNNLLDLDAAWKIASSFEEPAAAIIKHTNPSGVATAATVAEALRHALEADPVSAFGGIVASNRVLDDEAAGVVTELFLEVIVAPAFSDGAIKILSRKKNLRLVTTPGFERRWELRSAAGGVLVQTVDRIESPEPWRIVSRRAPSEEEHGALRFAWIVCAHVKSNAIVLSRRNQSVGIGAGQMSRVDAARLAITKAILPVVGTVGASDAFFPFPDGVEVLADAGVTAIIHPGGSVRDDQVIARADDLGLAMILTGERHFRH